MIRFTKTHLLILCPLGHVVESFALKDWAGSNIEAEIPEYQAGQYNRISRQIEKCSGYGHKKEGR